jgi:FKBP-type peptidyl-prolyl cis-trans isomerase
MTIGETRRCWVPQALAYNGRAGRPTGTVVFDIELIDFRPSPLIAPPDVKGPPDDAKRTPSGLAYKVLRPGKGTRSPSPFSQVSVHYTGWTTEGRMFDSSVPSGMPRSMRLDEVIKGWSEGVPMMTEGERMRLWVPEKLAYEGKSDPKGMLVFDIELVAIQ